MSGPAWELSSIAPDSPSAEAEPTTTPSQSTRALSVAILGADALLAAAPATPVQVAHACLAAGFAIAVPATWGEELIAAETARRAGARPGATVQCSCPLVAARLLAGDVELRESVIALVAPPVATARYVRAIYAPTALSVTYVGMCPGAEDVAIDARLTPEALFAIFATRDIALDQQPEVFESVIPPDRRRYFSQPGGAPTPEVLRATAGSALSELATADIVGELAQLLFSHRRILVDAAPFFGCVCAGGRSPRTTGDQSGAIREHVIALEPPRAPSPTVDQRFSVDLELPFPVPPKSGQAVATPPDQPAVGGIRDTPTTPRSVSPTTPRSVPIVDHRPRHSPPGTMRQVGGSVPLARSPDGRQLPRTYVARRRSSPRTVDRVEPPQKPRDPGRPPAAFHRDTGPDTLDLSTPPFAESPSVATAVATPPEAAPAIAETAVPIASFTPTAIAAVDAAHSPRATPDRIIPPPIYTPAVERDTPPDQVGASKVLRRDGSVNRGFVPPPPARSGGRIAIAIAVFVVLSALAGVAAQRWLGFLFN
jgi:hypothetical protein